MKRFPLIIFLFLFVNNSIGQGIPEINHWFFGDSTGIDFSSGSPIPISFNSPLYTYEGTCSISDTLGNLLFYTDGINVWNKVHAPMVNGQGLMGNASSTQSTIIVQRPCYKDRFYIFTTPAQGSGKLYYSEIDLSLDNGLGAVTSTKNSLLGANPVNEKLAVVWHTDEQSLWLICQEPSWSANRYFAYSVSASGVDTVPVESFSGMNDGLGFGYLKASPDGSTLACCSQQGVDVLDFDRTTGAVSLRFSIPQGAFPWYQFLYGAEFSPNGLLLYISTNYSIAQFNLTEPTSSDIIASAVIVNTHAVPFPLGSLQLAPDGKIYCAKYESFTLASIDNPNSPGISCNFIENALQLNRMCFYGLPTFQMRYHYSFDNCPDIPPMVIPEPETSLEIPNIITPNGDGINDFFQLKNLVQGQASLTISNRWGNIVFFTDSYTNNWNGEGLTDGVYFYLLYDTKKEETHSGSIQLIR